MVGMHLNLSRLLTVYGEAGPVPLKELLFTGHGQKGKKTGLFQGELQEAKQKLVKAGVRPDLHSALQWPGSKEVARVDTRKVLSVLNQPFLGKVKNQKGREPEASKVEPGESRPVESKPADAKLTDFKPVPPRPLKVAEAIDLLKGNLAKLGLKVKAVALSFTGGEIKPVRLADIPQKVVAGKEEKQAGPVRRKSVDKEKNSLGYKDEADNLSIRDSRNESLAKVYRTGLTIEEIQDTRQPGPEGRGEFTELVRHDSLPKMPQAQATFQSSQAAVFLDKVNQQLEAQAAAAQKRFEIQMEVDKLGKLKVGANQVNKDVHIQIFVESVEAKRWLENNLRPLFDSFSQGQIAVDSIEVSVRDEDADQEALFSQHYDAFHDKQHPGRRKGISGGSAGGDETQPVNRTPQLQRQLGYNTIEVWA